MNIAIDIDGVLANFVQGIVYTANMIWPERFPLLSVEPTDWAFSNMFPEREDFLNTFAKFLKMPMCWTHLTSYNRNMQALCRFRGNHPFDNIFFLTARREPSGGYGVRAQTESWLRLHGFPNPGVIICRREEKPGILADRGMEWFIDDCWPTVEQVRERRPECRSFLLKRPWSGAPAGTADCVTTLGQFFKEVERARKSNAGRS